MPQTGLRTSTDVYAVHMYTYVRAHIPIHDTLYLYMFPYYFVHIPLIKFYKLLRPTRTEPLQYDILQCLYTDTCLYTSRSKYALYIFT